MNHKRLLLRAAVLAVLLMLLSAGAQALELTAGSATMNTGASQYLTLRTDAGASVRTAYATWTTSDPAVAVVNAYGKVTAKGPGEAVITAAYQEETARYTVAVHQPVTRVSVPSSRVTVANGSTLTLLPTVQPENATDKTLTFTSSRPAVAEVDEHGVITPHSAGTTSVRITAASGRYVTVSVTVTQPVLSISLNSSDLVVFTGSTARLSATLLPANSTDKKVVWSSSDPAAATVNAYGTVTGRTRGETTITATASSGLTAACRVVVQEPVRRVDLQTMPSNIDLGTTQPMLAVAMPETADDRSLTYTSSNPAVATVDEKTGLITPVKMGRVTITATATSGKYARRTFTVTQPVTAISLPQAELTLDRGQRVYLKPALEPSNASNKKITYASSDPQVASVSASGQITARKLGTATITATASSGLTAELQLTVNEPVASVRFPASTLTLDTNTSASAGGYVLPEIATVKTLSYTSSKPLVASVDEATGVITGLAPGTAVITARSVNGKTARLTVTVVQPVTGVTLTPGMLTMDAGTSQQLKAAVEPANATNKKITYTSSDPAVATISAYGYVTARKAGTAILTATSNNGLVARTQLTVVQPVTRVSLSFSTKTLARNETLQVIPTVLPADATDPSLVWQSSNPTVVSVTAGGEMTGRSAGTATVTAIARNGKQASVRVTVKEIPASGLTLERYYLALKPGETVLLGGTITPSNASEQRLVFSSSAPDVVSVDERGLITALKNGTASISVSTLGSNVLTRTCTVSVASQHTRRLEGVTIGINPGHQVHGNSAPIPLAPGSSQTVKSVKVGATGIVTRTTEYEINLQVSLRLRDLLEAEGATVVITRTTNDVNLSNLDRAKIMNDAGCDLALQIHCNSSDNQGATGFGLYVTPLGSCAAQSKAFAEAMMQPVLKGTGLRGTGVHVSGGYASLNWSEVPSILVEMAYLSNPAEDRLLSSDAFQTRMAQSLLEGICACFE